MLFSFREAALITSITLIFTLAAKLLRLQNSEIKRQKDDITNKFNVFYPPCATAQHNFLSCPHENSWAKDLSPGSPESYYVKTFHSIKHLIFFVIIKPMLDCSSRSWYVNKICLTEILRQYTNRMPLQTVTK